MSDLFGEGKSQRRPAARDAVAALEAENARLRAALAERELRLDRFEARARLESQIRKVADALPALIAYVDADQRYLYNNQAYRAWIGDAAQSPTGRTMREVLGDDTYEPIRALVEQALAGERVSAERALRDREGALRHLHLDYIPDRRADGRVVGFYALVADVSRSRTIEAELRESEARFRAMADSAPAPVWVTGADGIAFVNKALADFFGGPAEALLGTGWTELIHPDDLPELMRRREQAWRGLEVYEFDARFRRFDGDWRWMHAHLKPRFDAAGAPAGFVGIAMDMTETRRAEDELRASERLLRAMFDNAGVGMVLMDGDYRIVEANAAFAAITGRDSAELVGRSCFDFTHEDDHPVNQAAIAAMADGAGFWAFEKRYLAKDGGTIWVHVTLSAAGEQVLAIVEDVTARKLAEQALRQSEERLRASTEAAAIGTWDLDPRSGELRWDSRCRAVFGLPPDAPVDYSIFLAGLHPDDREATAAAVERALDPEGAGTYAIEYRTIGLDDGIERWVAARGRAIFRDKAPVRFIGTVIDISERKRAEEELASHQAALHELNQSLEARIAAAIDERERVEEALRQAQKMEAVGQLTGGIAHDFNNLLTVIAGNLELAERRLAEAPDARLGRAIGNARIGAERAATLTQRLLAFSRRQPLAPRPTDANALIAGMTELLHRTLGETIAVETRLADGLGPVEVDPNQLESAILNLAVNARDAMPQGGRLTIETDRARTADDGAAVAILVADTGIGMSEEVARRAFEPFFTTKDVGKGTGLGLSMVYGFVKQSGGHLDIDSAPGEGTRVRILLRPAAEAAAAADEAEAAAPGPAGRETILVCEDDDDVRAYTVELLDELGYTVIAAADAAETLRRLEAPGAAIDLLFTDVVLPGGMSGAELAEQARQKWPDLRILFTTGYARDSIVHEGRLDPGVELLAKPFGYADLAARLRAVLDRR